jgi:hypothetical protein
LSSGRGPPEFLSSHPRTKNREEYLAKAVREKYPEAESMGKLGREEFVANVLSGVVDPSSAQPAAGQRARR